MADTMTDIMTDTTAHTTTNAMANTAANTNSEIVDLLHGRCRQYSLLARLFREEVDMAEIEALQGMRFPLATGNSLIDQGYKNLYTYMRSAWDDSVLELAIDYVRTFIGHGVNGYSAAYPFESVYTSERRLMMQEARAEVLQTLRENNLKRGTWNEGEDHIAVELEFMQILSQRAADALEQGNEDDCVEQLEKSLTFLNNHLLNWFPMMASDMEKFSRTLFYQGLSQLTLGYLQVDKETLEGLLINDSGDSYSNA